jgi:hypothetical protein
VYDTDQGQVFDWVSNPVNGGDNGNFYRYTDAHNDVGEQATDDGLHAPVGSNGLYSDIRHISFCFDLELDVEKTATAKFTRTYDWDITKTADETDWNLFKGDTGKTDYKVTVSKEGSTDSCFSIDGTITITNPNPDFDADLTGVTHVISTGSNAAVDCPHQHGHGDAAELHLRLQPEHLVVRQGRQVDHDRLHRQRHRRL